jgi:hypothetical protein
MSFIHRLSAAAMIVLLFVSCASTPTRAVRSEFEDIPVPKGLTFEPDRSTIIESPQVKAARLVYRGRIEIESLAAAMRSTLEGNGWRNVSSTTTSRHGTTQVYEKAGNSVQVLLWEGMWYTYVELTASRVLQMSR